MMRNDAEILFLARQGLKIKNSGKAHAIPDFMSSRFNDFEERIFWPQ